MTHIHKNADSRPTATTVRDERRTNLMIFKVSKEGTILYFMDGKTKA